MTKPQPFYTTPQHITHRLRLNRTPLHLLLTIPLSLLIQKLPLLIRTQPPQLRIPLLPLELIRRRLALLCLLLLVHPADLADLLVARLLDAAQGFGAEVCRRREVVGEAQEVLEEGERGIVVGLELEGEVDALFGLGVVEAGGC